MENWIAGRSTGRKMDGTLGGSSYHFSWSEAGRSEALDPSHQREAGTRRGRMGGHAPGTPQGHPSKTVFIIIMLLTTVGLAQSELIPFKKDENIWVYLAKNVLNISDFCLSGGTYVEQTFTSCLIGVGTPIANIQNYTIFISFSKRLTYRELYALGPTVVEKEAGMFSLKISAVAPCGECLTFTGCSSYCHSVANNYNMNCSNHYTLTYGNGHTKLPPGWFLICGLTVYSYVPANSTGGPCSLGRLTVFLPQKHHTVRTKRKLATALTPDCADDLTLRSLAEYIALTIFVMPVVMPGHLNKEIAQLACGMVKSLTATSRAIHWINQELSEIREAVLENRAATDYLLLLHNHGCEEFKGMCCFNLSDHFHLIEDNIKEVRETISNIKQRKGFFGLDLSVLTSWLPSLSGLQEFFLIFLLFLFCGLVACCCIHCSPLLTSCTQSLPSPPAVRRAKANAVRQEETFQLK